MNKNKLLKITIPAIVACFLWSTAFVGIKICLDYSPPLLLAGIRFMTAGLILLPFCGPLGTLVKEIRSNIKTILLVALFQTLGLYALFTTGMTMVPGAVGAIIIGATPITTSLITHFFVKGDRMSLSKTLKILLGFGGIVLVSISRKSMDSAGNNREIWGILLLLLATVASTVGNIFVAGGKKKISPLRLNSVQLFLGGLALFILSCFFEEGFKSKIDATFIFAMIYLSLLSAIAFSIWFHLLKKPEVKISDLNVWKFIVPVFGAINAWLLLPDESPQLMSIIGMVIVGISVALVYINPKRKGKKNQVKE